MDVIVDVRATVMSLPSLVRVSGPMVVKTLVATVIIVVAGRARLVVVVEALYPPAAEVVTLKPLEETPVDKGLIEIVELAAALVELSGMTVDEAMSDNEDGGTTTLIGMLDSNPIV